MGNNVADNRLYKYLKLFSDCIEYFMIVVAFFECNSIYVHRINAGSFPPDYFLYRLVLALLIIDILVHFLCDRELVGRIIDSLAIILPLYVYMFLFFKLNVLRNFNIYFVQIYIWNFIIILPFFIILFKIKIIEGETFDLLYKHAKFVCVFSVLSLIMYISTVVSNGMTASDLIYTVWSGIGRVDARNNFMNTLVLSRSGSSIVAGVSLLRNTGVFTEPLMYVVQLVTALFTEIFLEQEKRGLGLFRGVLISIVLFSTQSTYGLMLLAVAWGLFVIRFLIKKHKKVFIIPIIFAVLFAIVFFYNDKQSRTYEDAVSTSAEQHAEDFAFGLKAFLNKPLLGGGFGNEDYIREFMSDYRLEYNSGFSNSVMVILAEGGIMLGLLCMAPFFLMLLKGKRKEERYISYWIVGPILLYIGVIWHYHIFMMMIFAYGYAFLEVKRGGKLSLMETYPSKEVYGKIDAKALVTMVLGCACGILLALFGNPIWKIGSYVLRTNSWSVSLSSTKAFLLISVITINAVVFANTFKRKGTNIVSFALALGDVIFLFSYKFWYSLLNTHLVYENIWSEEKESLGLFYIWAFICGITCLFLGIIKRPKDYKKKIYAAGLFVVFGICLFMGFKMLPGKYESLVESKLDAVKVLTDNCEGAVYANDYPFAYHSANKKILYSSTRNSGFNAYSDASIIFSKGTNLKEMFDAGFEVTVLSDELLVYSNDEDTIRNLSCLGYKWYKYYPYEQHTGSSAMFMYPGKYEARYYLHVDRAKYEGEDEGKVLCSIGVTSVYGAGTIAENDVYLSDFNAKGNLILTVPFDIRGVTQGVELTLTPGEGCDVETIDITLKETPVYISQITKNGYGYSLSEKYFELDGTPFVLSQGYSQIERDYNLIGQVKTIRYLDSNGDRITINSGISAISYTYNKQGGVLTETYYDESDNVVESTSGYAIVKYEYDSRGNRAVTRFYDRNEKPVMTSAGYAVLKKIYDEEWHLIKEEHLDTKDNLIEVVIIE